MSKVRAMSTHEGTAIPTPIDFNSLHPTAEKLLFAALAMMEIQPIEKIGIERILEETKIARSSVYHHFDNFPHLLECAVAFRFAQETRKTINQLQAELNAADSRETFKRAVIAMNRMLQTDKRLPIRMQRIIAFAATDKNPRFQNMLMSEQQNITNAYAEILRSAQEKEWIRADADTQACAAFVQAMTIGRIIDDVSETRVDPQHWTEVSEQALIAILW